MKIFKFILWWWDLMDLAQRAMFAIILYVLGAFSVALIFGPLYGVYFVFGSIVSTGGISLIYFVFRIVSDKWKAYNRFIEKEQQMVVDRLRGR